ncbi:hypothetical protein BGX31_005289, partial [Mortierella sp. GBA43]
MSGSDIDSITSAVDDVSLVPLPGVPFEGSDQSGSVYQPSSLSASFSVTPQSILSQSGSILSQSESVLSQSGPALSQSGSADDSEDVNMDTVDLSSGTSSHSTTATPAPASQVFSVRPGLATLAAQLAFSMERQLYDNHLKWSSLADERLAALRVGNTELAASIKDMMTDLTEARTHIAKLGKHDTPKHAPILSPSKAISSSKVARLAADATP